MKTRGSQRNRAQAAKTPAEKTWVQARYEHAWRLRGEGLTYREIGERLGGLSRERARTLVVIGGNGGRTWAEIQAAEDAAEEAAQ